MRRMLYGSATKGDLMNRRIEEVDSGLASGGGEEEEEEEEDAREVRRQQRAERREYYQRHSPKTREEGRRTVSPSPSARRGSMESTGRDSSTSPPLSLDMAKTLPRRTKSTSTAAPSPPAAVTRKASVGGYAFGSSTHRFKAGAPDARNLGSTESLSTSHSSLTRTTSDTRVGGGSGRKKVVTHKLSVAKAWLQFQEDIEAAMLRKPGGGHGLYKNLTHLMQDRMDQLDQVGRPGQSVRPSARSSARPFAVRPSVRPSIRPPKWRSLAH